MKKEKRTVIYRLIGRINQNEAQQKKDLEVFAQASGLTITAEFIDNFLPHQQEKRQQLRLLMKGVRNQKFDCVLIWKLDCLACSLAHLSELLQEFYSLNIRFISIEDKMDLIHDKYLSPIHVLQKMIEFKAALLKERIREGMFEARQKGRTIGRPTTSPDIVKLVEELARNTDYSSKKIRILAGKTISYHTIRNIVNKVRDESNI